MTTTTHQGRVSYLAKFTYPNRAAIPVNLNTKSVKFILPTFRFPIRLLSYSAYAVRCATVPDNQQQKCLFTSNFFFFLTFKSYVLFYFE